MKSVTNIIVLAFLPALTLAVTSITNTTTFKPCFMGSDSTECPQDQECFQYFCYPKEGANDPLKLCKKTKECGSSVTNLKCYKPMPTYGICVSSEDYDMCESHEECQGRGDRCCGDYCCNKNYFKNLIAISCKADDEVCKVT